MHPDASSSADSSILTEGMVKLLIVPSGGERGPGIRDGVFFNPAMVENRDMSVLMMQLFVDSEMLPGRNTISILDGLTGSGVRALRFEKEIRWGDRPRRIVGNDRDTRAVAKARENARVNDIDLDFINEDLSAHLTSNRYSYVDVDPFGSPVPFLDQAVRSVLSDGVLAVTATDSAALTGSIPRVSRRRYGITLRKTSYMHETSCRALMGYLARLCATHEIGVEPLYFYSSDHFLRGYIRLKKGARKADSSLKNIGYLIERPPDRPVPVRSLDEIGKAGEEGSIMGPLWLGPLSDKGIMKDLSDHIEREEHRLEHIRSMRTIKERIRRALDEWGAPPGGFDIDDLSSKWKIQQPTTESIVKDLRDLGFTASRSRFSNKLIRTDADMETMREIMTGGR